MNAALFLAIGGDGLHPGLHLFPLQTGGQRQQKLQAGEPLPEPGGALQQ